MMSDIVGHVAPEYAFFVCIDCNPDPITDKTVEEHEFEPIYSDYPDLELGDINYEYPCTNCNRFFIGNIR